MGRTEPEGVDPSAHFADILRVADHAADDASVVIDKVDILSDLVFGIRNGHARAGDGLDPLLIQLLKVFIVHSPFFDPFQHVPTIRSSGIVSMTSLSSGRILYAQERSDP